MASLSLQIPTPVLLPNQAFRVEYKKTTDISWTLFGLQGNALFTMTGLDDSETYQIRITFLQSLSPLIECPPVVKEYPILPATECIDFTAEMQQGDGGYSIQLTATNFGSPYFIPCGGYKIVYGIPPTLNNFNVADFSITPVVNIPVSGLGAYTITVYAITCEGNYITCYDESLPIPSPITYCTPSTFSVYPTLTAPGLNYPTFTLSMTLNQSVPQQNNISVSYAQTGTILQGVPDPGGTQFFMGQNTPTQTIVLQVTPNANVPSSNGAKTIRYEGTVTDGCGGVLYFKAEATFAT